MELNSEIKKSFESLLTEDLFVQNVEEYTRSALETVYNLPQTH